VKFNTIGYAYSCFNLGRSQIKQGKDIFGIEKVMNAYQIFITENDYTGATHASIQLGNYYAVKKNYTLAQEFFNKGINYSAKNNLKKLKQLCLFNLGNLYNQLKDFNNSITIYNKLLKEDISEQRHSSILNNLSRIYILKKDYLKANELLLSSLQSRESMHDSIGIANNLINLCGLNLEANKYDNVDMYLRRLNEFVVHLNHRNLIQYHYIQTILSLKEKGLNKSVSAINNLLSIKDSLSNTAFSDKLIEMQKSFEMQEKDREIELLQKEDALQKAQLNNQKLLTLSLSVLALLLIGIGVLVNRQRRRLKKSQHILKQRKQEIITVNEELQRSNLSKDRILAVIGHDLRGPVGGLKELIELYMDLGEFEPEDFHNLLNAARESSTSTYHLLENLLSWANSQRGQIEFKPKTAHIKELVCHTVHLLNKAVNTRGILFECNVPDQLQLTVDENMLNTIVRNLVSNAIKFSPEKSTISITATEQAEEVILCIADEGIGFSAKESESLFTQKEAYFLEKGNSAKGTGLGLILCKEFVERHGGRIWTESDMKKGAKVCFSIPKELKELTNTEEAPAKKSRKKWRAWSNLF